MTEVRSILASVVLAVAVALPLPAFAAASVPLATFRTVHDLTLDEGGDGGEGGAVSGRLVTEFTGNSCNGYTTQSRFVTESRSPEGVEQTTDIRFRTFEAPDGRYTFETETYADERLVEESVGEAKRGAGGIAVALTKPEEKTVTLDAETLYPVEQVRRVIDAALAGEKFLAFDIFDGSEKGETVYKTSTIIGPKSTSGDDLGVETAVADAGIATMAHWPVTISYFKTDGGMTPLYTMSLVVYENGLTRNIRFDYGTFALVGKLTHLEVLPEEPCSG